jgi:protein ImuB
MGSEEKWGRSEFSGETVESGNGRESENSLRPHFSIFPQLALLPEVAPEARIDTAPATQSHRLWLCVHLPLLPVDVLDIGAGIPCAVVETVHNRPQVLACNAAAARFGVRPGLALPAALALCAELDVRERDRRAECARLNDIAAAAWQLSATVSLYDAGSIVLEIGGSLKLFNGLGGALRRAREVFAKCGAEFVFAVAGTPRAACWLARGNGVGVNSPVTSGKTEVAGNWKIDSDPISPRLLRGLPVEVLGVEEKIVTALRRSGVRTVGALLRLPRAGVARRFGPGMLQVLDQALGRDPEPLALYTPLQTFRAAEEIYPPTDGWTRLAPLAEKLLQRLEHSLLRRQAATQRVNCFLYHEHAPVTVLRIETTRYERRAAAWLPLLQQHFERMELPAAVTGIGIRCDHAHVIPAANLDLVDGRAEAEQQWQQLLDQMNARLGAGRLSWPQLRADHRPERENAVGVNFPEKKMGSESFSRWNLEKLDQRNIGKMTPTPFSSLRPAWLLPQPERLRCADETPRWHGPLSLSKWPERIEAGWWDGMDVSRDYYLARNPAGSQLWVYRDRREGEWYLQGVFG